MKPLDLNLFGNTPTLRHATRELRRTDGRIRRFKPVSIIEDSPLASKPANDPETIVAFWDQVIATQADYEPEKEQLCCIILNSRLIPTAWHRISLGGLNQTAARMREIFRPVLLAAGYGFILCHNHPSGDPSPSSLDERFTRKLVEASDIMDLRFLDHVVLVDAAMKQPGIYSRHYSFRECGIIH